MNSGVNRPALAPARLDPIFVPRIWGARNLAPLYPQRLREPEPVGEAWLTGNDCRFATGEFAGRSLGEVWPGLSEQWTGTRVRGVPRIPLLVKFIFPEQQLSVQVHPDDTYASRFEAEAGGMGKTEMWYVISAREGAELLVGLRPEVTADSFSRAISDGTAEDCLEHVTVRAGDAIFVPAGTAHTIGPGVLLCEVQEHSDITYRVFDYNRVDPQGKSRPLHIRQAMEVMRFGKQRGGLCEPVRVTRGALHETLYAACAHFATERWEFREPVAASTSPEHFDLLIFLAGEGRIEYHGGSEPFAPAQVWLLPAALGTYELHPAAPVTLLRTYVPDLNESARRLADANVAESAWSRVVHR